RVKHNLTVSRKSLEEANVYVNFKNSRSLTLLTITLKPLVHELERKMRTNMVNYYRKLKSNGQTTSLRFKEQLATVSLSSEMYSIKINKADFIKKECLLKTLN
ncbi:unnamed protein product, partial [Owenia fusiformis]